MPKYYQKYFDPILDTLNNMGKPKFIIGIDGPGCSGKSTFAKELIENLVDTEIVHMDDFYKEEDNRNTFRSDSEVGGWFDWMKFEREVLIPFSCDEEIKFQKYDWPSDSLKEWHSISRKMNLIVEGVYSTRKEINNYYDLRIWIDCPKEVRLERGLARDGFGMKEYWLNIWMKQEDDYLEKHKSNLSADFIINGNGLL